MGRSSPACIQAPGTTHWRRRAAALLAIDLSIWSAALCLATWVRFDLRTYQVEAARLTTALVVAWLLAAAFGLLLGLYRRQWRIGAFQETVALAAAAGLTGAAFNAVNLLGEPRLVPLGASFTAPALALLGCFGVRYGWRARRDRAARPQTTARRLLVFGAGAAATQIVTALQRTPDAEFVPVGLMDDDRSKAHWRIAGVPVLGGRASLVAAARKVRAEALLLAVPSAGPELVKEVLELGREAGLPVKVLPSVNELLGARVGAGDIRPVSEADLLGRRQIETDLASIAGYLTGKRVLVTGAGGSIGSELCRQVLTYGPDQLVMLDRDESALHALQLSIEGRGLLDSRNLVVADIRDRERLSEVFAEHRPQVVFHTAALKHLPLLEMHPDEGVKTNVHGTQNVLEAAAEVDVERFVNISTDKAANPISVLGRTKRMAEQLTAGMAEQTGRPYLSVRFGNVLGSRGSVVPAFQRQIEAGGPVTVTHPEVTRFFMTIPEAVQLVVQAGAIGDPGEVLILDMGEAVRIADLAQRLVAASGKRIDIVYTGLRPGEKLNEELIASGEIGARRCHPLITHAFAGSLLPESARAGKARLQDGARAHLP